MATIEGIDIFYGGKTGKFVLFSSKALKEIGYGVMPDSVSIVKITVKDDADPWKAALHVELRQGTEWDDSVIFELSPPRT